MSAPDAMLDLTAVEHGWKNALFARYEIDYCCSCCCCCCTGVS